MEKVNEGIFRIDFSNGVSGLVFMVEELLAALEPAALGQLAAAAQLPGVEKVCLTPDAHVGKGVAIGTVIKMRKENAVVVPAAVGVDIGCGMLLVGTSLTRETLGNRVAEFVERTAAVVPMGDGKKWKHNTDEKGWLTRIVGTCTEMVAPAAFEGNRDIVNGSLSEKALARGRETFISVGGGNHFLELQEVEVLDPDVAEAFDLVNGGITFQIHCGSRGFGHQIAVDYTKELGSKDGDLAYAPLDSDFGRRYMSAHNAALRFAKHNRTHIGYLVGRVLRDMFPSVYFTQVYDLTHNMVSLENGYLVYRKGATRAYPAHNPMVPNPYEHVGHPILIPGSMGTASYVLVAAPGAGRSEFSCCHGAGRTMSRGAARRTITEEAARVAMGGTLTNRPLANVLDEAPQAYKSVDLVVQSIVAAGIAKPVARLRPLASLKG